MNGISIMRNPILLSTLQYILPYKGLGTGIRRSILLYNGITLENKVDDNQFKVTIQRPVITDSNGIEWTQMLDELFGSNIPKNLKWTDKDDIIFVLNKIGLTKYKNHAFLPGGGGLDLLGAESSSEENCIELNLNGLIYICRPSFLQFESFDTDNTWFYFRLETDTLRPKLKSHIYRGYYEDLIELKTGEFVEREKEENDNILKYFYRYVTLILSGSIVIFSKSSFYNAVPDTYDGRHNKMSSSEFRTYINNTINKIKK